MTRDSASYPGEFPGHRLFYRGISADQVPGNYYVWQGPDGSRLFGIRLGDYARASFFHLVDRPVVHDRGRGDQSHDWSAGGKPFRVCGTGSATPYHFHLPPTGWHPERIEEAFAELESVDLGTWETPWALAMECDDSTGPFVLTPRIVAAARGLVTNGKEIVHGDLPEFVRRAREHFSEHGGEKELTVVTGEMRHPQRAGVWTDLYAEVQATRMPTKYANRRAEFALQRKAEPLATVAWCLGVEYPAPHLDRAWSMLVQSHAHDSIGGCGMDAVDDDVRNRLRQIEIVCACVAEDAFREIAGRIDTGDVPSEEILLVVFNPLPRRRDAVMRALFPTCVETDVAHAEVAFDVVERAIPLPDTREWREPYKPVQPQQNFVDLSDGRHGVAILNRGLPQYEAVDDANRTVALTLLRCNRNWSSIRLAHYPDQPGMQLQSTHTFEYAILPHEGGWEAAGVLDEALRFNVDPLVGAAGPGPGDLPRTRSFLEVEGDGLVMAALKRGEWYDAVVVRVSNPTSSQIAGAVRVAFPVAAARLVNMMEPDVEGELGVDDGRIALTVPAKRVVTLKLERAQV